MSNKVKPTRSEASVYTDTDKQPVVSRLPTKPNVQRQGVLGIQLWDWGLPTDPGDPPLINSPSPSNLPSRRYYSNHRNVFLSLISNEKDGTLLCWSSGGRRLSFTRE